jgi:isoleucyl-tRNA synthetase
VIRDVEAYLDDVSNWYVRVSRRRFWRSGHEADKRAAYFALFTALRSTVVVLSPIIPFVTERIWQNAVRGLEAGATESVHHADWPELQVDWRDEALLRRTEAVRNVVSLGLKVRAQAQVRVRQPLKPAYVLCAPDTAETLKEQLEVIKSELNVKDVVGAERNQIFNSTVNVDWKKANPILRQDAPAFRKLFESLDKPTRDSLALQIAEGGGVKIHGSDHVLPADVYRIDEEPKPNLRVAEENGLLVALDLELTDSLKREGLARDLIRNLQVARKDAGLSVSQRIELGLATEDATVRQAICEHREYIMDELLATTLEYGVLEPFRAKVDVGLDGASVLATFRWQQAET